MVIVPTEKRFDWQHTPVILFALILTNVLVFLLYQSGDGPKLERALSAYQEHRLLEVEWPIYERYLSGQDEELLQHYQGLHSGSHFAELAAGIVMDQDFRAYLEADGRNFVSNLQLEDWRFGRSLVDAEINSLSYYAGGLVPSDLRVFSLLSSQFLHGDLMHLLGNLFFLLVCGFAVEAAIGHWRFLGFYLLTGVAGGLAHALLDLHSTTPLVGASGAISGVMAMYLGVFRFKRIEFFYWFFVFVGYFRAPALLILPVYIGKELLDFFSNPDSNVAFMAHAGGFVAGGLLIAATLLINPKLIDETYVEEDQQQDPFQAELAKVFSYIESFQFRPALRAVEAMIAGYGLRPELAILRSNLLKIDRSAEFQEAAKQALSIKDPSPRFVDQQARLWQDCPELQDTLDDASIIDIGFRFARPEQFTLAEKILTQLRARNCEHPELPLLARKLAQVATNLKQDDKRQRYQQLADSRLVK